METFTSVIEPPLVAEPPLLLATSWNPPGEVEVARW